MSNHTEAEMKVSKVIKDVLADSISTKPQLGRMADELSIMTISLGKDMSDVIIVKMPEELLRHSRLVYGKMIAGFKKIFNNAMVLTMNNNEIPARKTYNPNRIRENVVNDLLFPSVVAARALEVESRDEMKQLIYLDAKNQLWSHSDLNTIEKVLEKVLCESFTLGFFNAGH